VWTQDDGMYLGQVTGRRHSLFRDFWMGFHHDLGSVQMAGGHDHMDSPMPSPSDSTTPDM
jgi:hypothetical protein